MKNSISKKWYPLTTINFFFFSQSQTLSSSFPLSSHLLPNRRLCKKITLLSLYYYPYIALKMVQIRLKNRPKRMCAAHSFLAPKCSTLAWKSCAWVPGIRSPMWVGAKAPWSWAPKLPTTFLATLDRHLLGSSCERIIQQRA